MPKRLTGEALRAQWLNDVGGSAALYASPELLAIDAALVRVCHKRDGKVGYSYDTTSLAVLSAELQRLLAGYIKRGVRPGAQGERTIRAAERLENRLLDDEKGADPIATERAEMCKAIGYLLGNCTVTFDWIKEVAAVFVDASKIALRTAPISGPDGSTHTPWDAMKGAFAEVGISPSAMSAVYDHASALVVGEGLAALHKTSIPSPTPPASVTTLPKRRWVSDRAWSSDSDIVVDPEIKGAVWRNVNKVWEALKSFFENLLSNYKANVSAYLGKYFNDIKNFLTTLVDLIIRQVASSHSFLFTNSVKLKDQLIQAFDSVFVPIVQSIKNRSVRFSKGVARNVIGGVTFGQIFMGMDSLYQIGQSAAVIGTSFLSTNLGAVVNGMASIVRNAYKLCLRYWEYMMMSKACDEARRYWMRPDDDWSESLPGQKGSTVDIFSKWFAVYARWVPSVAATVLRSRICGSNLAWLQFSDMLNIDPGAFTRGAEYLRDLAVQADIYAAQSGVKILANESVKLYLETRKNMLQPDAAQKGWQSQADVMTLAARMGGLNF